MLFAMPRIPVNRAQEYLLRARPSLSTDDLLRGPAAARSVIQDVHEKFRAEKLREDLTARLKAFPFPYEGHGSGETFYEHLEGLGLLDCLLHGQLFWEVKLWLELEEVRKRERELSSQKRSAYKLPVAFHQQMATAILNHIRYVHGLLAKHGGGENWVRDYLHAAELQLLWELRCLPSHIIMYPYIMKKNWRLTKNDGLLDMYESVSEAFTAACRRKPLRGMKELLYAVTALIWSPPACLATGSLKPSPATVKGLVLKRQEGKTTKPDVAK